jgi:hypothetical protein
MPGGFNLKSVAPLPAPSMAVSLSSPTPRTPAQRYQLEALSSGSRAAAVEGRVVTEQAPEAQTKAPGAHTGDKGRFGRLEGREDNPKSPTLKPKQKKSILFNVVHFFTKG